MSDARRLACTRVSIHAQLIVSVCKARARAFSACSDRKHTSGRTNSEAIISMLVGYGTRAGFDLAYAAFGESIKCKGNEGIFHEDKWGRSEEEKNGRRQEALAGVVTTISG